MCVKSSVKEPKVKLPYRSNWNESICDEATGDINLAVSYLIYIYYFIYVYLFNIIRYVYIYIWLCVYVLLYFIIYKYIYIYIFDLLAVSYIYIYIYIYIYHMLLHISPIDYILSHNFSLLLFILYILFNNKSYLFFLGDVAFITNVIYYIYDFCHSFILL